MQYKVCNVQLSLILLHDYKHALLGVDWQDEVVNSTIEVL